MRCFKKSGCELLLPSHLTFFFLSGSTESQRKTYSASSISCHAISDLHPQPHHQLHPSRLQLPPSIPVLVTIVLLVLLIMLLVFYVMCKIIVHGPTPPPPLLAAAEEQAQLPVELLLDGEHPLASFDRDGDWRYCPSSSV